MRRYPLYIFDLDGTLYRGSQAIDGAAQILNELRRRGSKIRFLTNNSGMPPAQQAAKLEQMGFQADASEFLSSGMGTAIYLTEHNLTKVFVVGEPGLVEVLESKGIQCVSPDEKADAVVVGICRSFTYELLNQAMQQILSGAKFVATNTDASYPMEEGRVVPGAGSIVAAIQTCSGTKPLVIGKPNPFLVDLTLRLSNCEAKDALVIGDRYETDIVSGQKAGCDTLLVLTGVTKVAPPGQAHAQSLNILLE